MKAGTVRYRFSVLKVLAAPLLLAVSLAPMVLTATSASAITGINQLSINDVTQAEGNAGTTNFTFTVTLSPPAPDTVTVAFATADGTAHDPSDYAAQNATLTFMPGDTSKTITVAVVGDTATEPNETFTVNLSNPTNATIARAQGVGTIVNDDGATLSINDVNHTEGNAGNTNADFTVTLSQSSASTVTVHWATADGTAKAPGDYATNGGDLTYTPGQTTKTVSVAVVGDTSAEPNETFFVNLTAPTNATVADAQGVGTIVNDDGTPPGLSINDINVSEGNAGTTNFTFTVSLAPASTQTVTVHWSTADGTAKAPSDYAANSGDLTFAPSENSKTVTVLVNGDTSAEPNETFTVNLSNPDNAAIGKAQGVGTILNDDGAVPTLSINDVSMPEGNSGTTNATFTVTLSPASTQTVTVAYATADGTAQQPGDYLATSGTLTFNPGDTSKPINVPVVGDSTPESTETFTVNLSNPNNAAIGKAQGVGTIVNDDGPGLTINDVSHNEGNSGTTSFDFTVTMSAASAQTVTVDYATADGSAHAPEDYTAKSGTLTFAPSETTKTVTVLVNGDTVPEPNEMFTVNLSNPSNAAITDGQGLGTITNDDAAPPSLTINDVSHLEGNSGTTNFDFTVTLSAASTLPVTVDFATANGGATAPSDYASQTSTLTFAPSETTKTITVAVVGDPIPEPDETFFVNLSNPTNATIADPQGMGTITNDDGQPGGYTVKSTGGVFAYNGAAAATGSPSWATDVARGIAENHATGVGYVVDDWGGLHPFNGAPAATGGPYWPGQDIARDVALIPNSNAGYVLDYWGGLHAFNGAAAPSGGPYFPGLDVARRVVILANGTGGYVLDNWGGLHPFAIGAGPMPAAVTNAAYWFGQNVARGVVLTGGGGYTLDYWGALHPFSIGAGTAPPAATGGPYWVGQDIARGLVLAPGGGGYVLDYWGGLHPFTAGGTPPGATGGFYVPGADLARGIT